MIRLNGSVWVDDVEIFFDNLEVELDEDLELPFDELIEDDFDDEDYCDGDCEDCYCCEDEDEFLNPLEELIEEYTELLSDECICPDCIREILTSFVNDLFDEE